MRPRKVGKGYTHRPPDFVPLPPASPRGPVAIAPPRTASPPTAVRARNVGKGATLTVRRISSPSPPPPAGTRRYRYAPHRLPTLRDASAKGRQGLHSPSAGFRPPPPRLPAGTRRYRSAPHRLTTLRDASAKGRQGATLTVRRISSPSPPPSLVIRTLPHAGGRGTKAGGRGDSTPLPPPLPHFEFSTRRLRQRGAPLRLAIRRSAADDESVLNHPQPNAPLPLASARGVPRALDSRAAYSGKELIRHDHDFFLSLRCAAQPRGGGPPHPQLGAVPQTPDKEPAKTQPPVP